MKRKKTLLIHIGTGKTGTTFLQNFFYRNRRELRRHGVEYPDLGVQSGAHHLLSPHQPPFLVDQGWRFLETEEWVPKILKLKRDRILISSELMASGNEEAVRNFLRSLAPNFRIEICVYLRRQDDAIMASYNQQVKAGVQKRGIEYWVDSRLEPFDYMALLKRWEPMDGAIRVRPYEPSSFANNNIADDFLHHFLQIQTASRFNRDVTRIASNPRLPPEAIDFKIQVNNLFPDISESGRFNPSLFEYAKEMGGSSGAMFIDHTTLTHEQRVDIITRFSESNEYIARHFMKREDGVLFQPLARNQSPLADGTSQDRSVERSMDNVNTISAWLRKKHPEIADTVLKRAQDARDDPSPLVRQAALLLVGGLRA